MGIDDIRSALVDIAPAYGISKAYLFGSFARGEQTDDSDIDLVVILARPLGLPVDIVFGETQLYEPIRKEFNRDKVEIYAA